MTAVPEDQQAPVSGEPEPETVSTPALSQAARRERLEALAQALGESSGAIVEGDKLIQEAGQGVAIHGRVDPDG
ncbi:MAG TPA: hypothetical protein VKU87_09870, partial [Thermomicrobiaceae bacterium]|nr:hypothetical protein [Thermomicrobiaceae bacterium]